MALANPTTELFDHLADLFVYPVAGFRTRFDQALDCLEAEDVAAAEKLAPLAQKVGDVSEEDLEELYTRTFDINPSCTLEIGWQLFGEDYNRGSFLVHMRELMRELGVEEGTELPDHVMHVLPVLGRLDPEEAVGFSHRFLQPALDKMLEAFADPENPYRGAVEAVRDHLVTRYGASEILAGAEEVRQSPYDGIPGGHPTPRDLDLSAYAPGPTMLRKPDGNGSAHGGAPDELPKRTEG